MYFPTAYREIIPEKAARFKLQTPFW